MSSNKSVLPSSTDASTSLLLCWPCGDGDHDTQEAAEFQRQGLLGWWRRVNDGASLGVIVVAAVVPLTVAKEKEEDEHGIRALQQLHCEEEAMAVPMLLGEYLPSSAVAPCPRAQHDAEALWLVVTAGPKPNGTPRIQSLALPSFLLTTPDLCITLLMYQRPRPRPCRLLLTQHTIEPGGTPSSTKMTDLDWALQHMGLFVPPLSRKKEEEEEEEEEEETTPVTRWSRLTHNSLVCGHLLRRVQCVRSLFRLDKEARLASLVHLGLDMLVGAVLGALLWQHQDEVRHFLTDMYARSFVSPHALTADVEWLYHHPGGFKLNVPLTQRLGALVLVVVDLTRVPLSTLVSLAPSLPVQALVAVGVAGGGLTTLLAVAFDVLRLCTLQATLLFAIFARLYNLELSLLSSLWYLFRGKKKNILRHRTDSATEYSTPQLLLGTLLFTILTTLFLTLFVFYAFFTGLHLGVLALQGAVWVVFVLWRDLPTYLLVVYACQPARFVMQSSFLSSLKGLTFHLVTPEEEEEEDRLMVVVTRMGAGMTTKHLPNGQAAKRQKKKKGRQEVSTSSGTSSDFFVSAAGRRRSASPPNTTENDGAMKTMPSRVSVLRLEQQRMPISSLFYQYARTHRLFWEACPTPGTTLSMLLSGALIPRQSDDDDEEKEEEEKKKEEKKKEVQQALTEGPPAGGPRKRRNRLVFLRYQSFAQVLTRVAWASSSSSSSKGSE